MSIRPIDNSLIIPQTVHTARDAAALANKGQVTQQFSVILTDKETEHQFQAPQEVTESKESDAVDQDGRGGGQSEEHHAREQAKEEADEFSLTSTTIDIRI